MLCLHLKRFRWNNCFRQKIDTSIMFPVTALDMSQYVLSSPHETRRSGAGSTLYDLAAVIVHHGTGYLPWIPSYYCAFHNSFNFPNVDIFPPLGLVLGTTLLLLWMMAASGFISMTAVWGKLKLKQLQSASHTSCSTYAESSVSPNCRHKCSTLSIFAVIRWTTVAVIVNCLHFRKQPPHSANRLIM